jgi:hypothetical protein
VQIVDVQANAEDLSEASAAAHLRGLWTIFHVPLLSEGEALGTIGRCGAKADLFTDKQIDLFKTTIPPSSLVTIASTAPQMVAALTWRATSPPSPR